MDTIMGVDFAKGDDQPVLIERQQVFDADAYRAHLRWNDLLWRHCILDTGMQRASGVAWFRDVLCGGDCDHQPNDMWLYHPNCLVQNPYDDFRRSLGMPPVDVHALISDVAHLVWGYLYGEQDTRWLDEMVNRPPVFLSTLCSGAPA